VADDPKDGLEPEEISGDDLDAATSEGGEVDDVLDEVGPEGTTPTPDPLKHASAYVDEAKLAEAGAAVPEPDGEGFDDVEGGVELGDDYAAAPDQLEAPEPTARSQAAATAAAHTGPRKQRGKVLTFLGHCVDELRRVQWPNRQQVGQGTAVTLGFVVIAGSFLGLMDAIWKPVVEAIL
jgi:preprotein translocase SecE subunit